MTRKIAKWRKAAQVGVATGLVAAQFSTITVPIVLGTSDAASQVTTVANEVEQNYRLIFKSPNPYGIIVVGEGSIRGRLGSRVSLPTSQVPKGYVLATDLKITIKGHSVEDVLLERAENTTRNVQVKWKLRSTWDGKETEQSEVIPNQLFASTFRSSFLNKYNIKSVSSNNPYVVKKSPWVDVGFYRHADWYNGCTVSVDYLPASVSREVQMVDPGGKNRGFFTVTGSYGSSVTYSMSKIPIGFQPTVNLIPLDDSKPYTLLLEKKQGTTINVSYRNVLTGQSRKVAKQFYDLIPNRSVLLDDSYVGAENEQILDDHLPAQFSTSNNKLYFKPATRDPQNLTVDVKTAPIWMDRKIQFVSPAENNRVVGETTITGRYGTTQQVNTQQVKLPTGYRFPDGQAIWVDIVMDKVEHYQLMVVPRVMKTVEIRLQYQGAVVDVRQIVVEVGKIYDSGSFVKTDEVWETMEYNHYPITEETITEGIDINVQPRETNMPLAYQTTDGQPITFSIKEPISITPEFRDGAFGYTGAQLWASVRSRVAAIPSSEFGNFDRNAFGGLFMKNATIHDNNQFHSLMGANPLSLVLTLLSTKVTRSLSYLLDGKQVATGNVTGQRGEEVTTPLPEKYADHIANPDTIVLDSEAPAFVTLVAPTAPEKPDPPEVPEKPEPPVDPPEVPEKPEPPEVPEKPEPPEVPEKPEPPVDPPEVPEKPEPPVDPPEVPEKPKPPVDPPEVPEKPEPPVGPPEVPERPKPPKPPVITPPILDLFTLRPARGAVSVHSESGAVLYRDKETREPTHRVLPFETSWQYFNEVVNSKGQIVAYHLGGDQFVRAADVIIVDNSVHGVFTVHYAPSPHWSIAVWTKDLQVVKLIPAGSRWKTFGLRTLKDGRVYYHLGGNQYVPTDYGVWITQ
ncbi:SLAP domain-containing protein [Schleiferilactobacillus shenzhenensis]|nr:SLAP domain-containing protein [Schleiferilactobacillus shenzhenensis]